MASKLVPRRLSSSRPWAATRRERSRVRVTSSTVAVRRFTGASAVRAMSNPRAAASTIAPSANSASVTRVCASAPSMSSSDLATSSARPFEIGRTSTRTRYSCETAVARNPFAGGNVLHVLGDERRDGHAEIRLDDGPVRIDDLAEDVLAAGHQLRPAIPEGAAASRTPDERRLGQGVVYLLEELVLDDDVHRDRCADRGDRDRRGGEKRDPEPEAHGSFMT